MAIVLKQKLQCSVQQQPLVMKNPKVCQYTFKIQTNATQKYTNTKQRTTMDPAAMTTAFSALGYIVAVGCLQSEISFVQFCCTSFPPPSSYCP